IGPSSVCCLTPAYVSMSCVRCVWRRWIAKRGGCALGGNRSRERHLPLSARGWQQLCLYLDQYRCQSTSATVERVGGTFLFLTETYHPFTKNALTLLFARLRQRTGLPHVAVCMIFRLWRGGESLRSETSRQLQ